jgi:hypothetical protein
MKTKTAPIPIGAAAHLATGGCAAQQPEVRAEPYVPSFDAAPPSTAMPGVEGIFRKMRFRDGLLKSAT